MADIYKIDPAGFSFKRVGDYWIVPSQVIGNYFEHARGSGTDLFVIKVYTEDGDSFELIHGYIPEGHVENIAELRLKQIHLGEIMDIAINDAKLHLSVNPKNVYQHHTTEGYDAVFVKCKHGYFSCGWYDNAKTRKKGLKMAAFMVYAYGIINAKTDPVLCEICYKYLPYDSELGRVDIADNIIAEGLRPEILLRNNTPSKVIRIVDGQ